MSRESGPSWCKPLQNQSFFGSFGCGKVSVKMINDQQENSGSHPEEHPLPVVLQRPKGFFGGLEAGG
jgi:hypothetical protein